MKRIKSNVNINQLLHDVPESTQEVIRGGTSIEASEGSNEGSEAMAVIRPKRHKETLVPTPT